MDKQTPDSTLEYINKYIQQLDYQGVLIKYIRTIQNPSHMINVLDYICREWLYGEPNWADN